MQDVKTFSGINIDSDHNMLAADIQTEADSHDKKTGEPDGI